MRLARVLLCAVLWGVLVASVVTAQGTQGASGTIPGQETPSRPVFQSLKDFGAFGADLGGMLFLGDKDASDGALARPSLHTTFRYRFSENWVGVGEFGFGWNAYRDKGDTVMAVTSGTMGAYRRFSGAIGVDWRIGGGVGFYRWNYKFSGKSIRDRETKLFYRGFDPGVFGGLEVEKRLAAHVTLIATSQIHHLFSGNEKDFPTMFGGNDSYASAKVGINYHFSPYEGILWERKVNRTIKLTSGKAGS